MPDIIENIRCRRTRNLRCDGDNPSEGNAQPIYNKERECRVQAHCERVQKELCLQP